MLLIGGVIVTIVAAGIATLLIFHPLFRVQVIKIDGLVRTRYEDVQSAANNIINAKQLGVFPRNNYFLINHTEIEDIIKRRFLLENVTVEQKFPNVLSLRVTERTGAAIFLQNGAYIAKDANGSDVEKVGKAPNLTTTTPSIRAELNTHLLDPKWSKLPLVIYPDSFNTSPEKDRDIMAGILAWDNYLKKNMGGAGKYYVMDIKTTGSIKTADGLSLLVDIVENREAQFLAIEALVKNKKFDRSSVSYIDVRFPGKVFWK
jgi:cell division septal protein FtsQ